MKQLFPLLLLFLFGCSNLPDESFNIAVTSINADDLDKHLAIIASDEFQGRRPSTIGEEKTINYLKDEFEKLGLKPGNKDSYFQPVPLVDIVTDVNKELVIKGNSKTISLKFADEFVATSSDRKSVV